jgi:hypothetical protein
MRESACDSLCLVLPFVPRIFVHADHIISDNLTSFLVKKPLTGFIKHISKPIHVKKGGIICTSATVNRALEKKYFSTNNSIFTNNKHTGGVCQTHY